MSAVADDSTFPELFELLREQRARWSVSLVPWRNLREVFGVLRRAEILALLIDWGYRSDGVPVRLFDAWTTLPAGPAVLSARTGAPILHVSVRRTEHGFRVTPSPIIRVASTEPAEILRASQALAAALEATIVAAPEQWYSFKPLWPAEEDEARSLAERAAAMAANRRDPGPRPKDRSLEAPAAEATAP